MFKQACPQLVSNKFEAFIPMPLAESLHPILAKVTNNNMKKWNGCRPMVLSPSQFCDQSIDDFIDNESVLAQSLYGEYLQSGPSAADDHTTQLPSDIFSYTASRSVQCGLREPSVSCHIYHEPVLDMKCVQRPSPMLEDPYFQWDTRQGRGSFAQFSSARRDLKDVSSDTLSEQGHIASTQKQLSYAEVNLPAIESMELGPCPHNENGEFQTSNKSHDQPASIAQEPIAIGRNFRAMWWRETSRNADEDQTTQGLYFANDGLSRYQNGDIWSSRTSLANDWSSQVAAAHSTISPKLLTLNPSSASSSSSESSQGVVVSDSDSSSVHNIEEESGISGLEQSMTIKQPVPIRPLRRIFPKRQPSPQKNLPALNSSNFNSTEVKGEHSKRRVATAPSERGGVPRAITPAAIQNHAERSSSRPIPRDSNILKSIAPKSSLPEEQNWGRPSKFAANAQAVHHRNAKDDFLLRSRLAGMSYKVIRQQGKFTEAESTLRGRFRTLTKHKSSRVRKPEWTENDVRLLKKAVHKFTRSSRRARNRVPWKVVADYIADNGGSYHFGNATCRKRWDELHGES